MKLALAEEVEKTPSKSEIDRQTFVKIHTALGTDKMQVFLQYFRGGNQPSTELYTVPSSPMPPLTLVCRWTRMI